MPIHANTIKQLANNDPKLTRVIVNNKNLTDADIAPLLLALQNNSNLEYLDLSRNYLTDKSAIQLKNILLKNEKLFYLNIYHNFIRPEYIDQIDLILWERKKFDAMHHSARYTRDPISFWREEKNEATILEQWDDANDPENANNPTFSFKPK